MQTQDLRFPLPRFASSQAIGYRRELRGRSPNRGAPRRCRRPLPRRRSVAAEPACEPIAELRSLVADEGEARPEIPRGRRLEAA